MSRGFAVTAAAILLAGCATLRPFASGPNADERSQARQILLTVPQPSSSSIALTGPAARRYVQRRGYGPTPSVERTLINLAKDHGIQPVDGWPIASLNVYCEVFYVPQGLMIEEVIKQLSEDSRVDLVQPMNTFRTSISRYDDPYADLQTAVTDLDVQDAHKLATGKSVLVAVIDSAVDTSHPDLRGRVPIDRDLVENRMRLKKGEVHGTAVAGIIASASNNDEGIVGVAPDARIAALRACWSETDGGGNARCSSFSLAKALEVALTLDPAVINLSLTGPFDPLLAKLLDQAVKRGIIVVAAEPETADARYSFPASQQHVIVASSEVPDVADLPKDCLPAPGQEILTTTPDAGYAFLSGNSLAAAHVSGVIALLKQRDPAATATSIHGLLRDTSTWTGRATSINACRALERLINGGGATPVTNQCPSAQ